MIRISVEEFRLRQPGFPVEVPTDKVYLKVANDICNIIADSQFGATLHDGLKKRVALTIADYLQDIIDDAGLWRAFIDTNRRLYGFSVPFHEKGEEYVDYELNKEDIRFLVWYSVAMLDENKRMLNPHQTNLLECADNIYNYIEGKYEELPWPKGFKLIHELDITDSEKHDEVMHFGQWLFLHSYLLTPAFALTLHEIMSGIDFKNEDAHTEFNQRLENAITEEPTGPLALFTPEWVSLILKGSMPKEVDDKNVNSSDVHPYYTKFTNATGGKEIRWFGSYEEMNDFFISALGWEANHEHLSQAKGAHDYVLMVNKRKGMLMARDVARCIAAPDNSYYNESFARRHAIELLTVRGRCPADLLRVAITNHWIKDASFPQSGDCELVNKNADFIARCFLQKYYRD